MQERKDAFLYANATAGDNGDQRASALGRSLKSKSDLFAHYAAHSAAHEAEVEYYDGRLRAAYRAVAGNYSFSEAGAALIAGHPPVFASFVFTLVFRLALSFGAPGEGQWV